MAAPPPGKIDRIELFHIEIPLPTPFFPSWIPGYSQDHLRSTLFRVTTRDGLVGHASGVAINREREGIGELVGPFLVGIDPYDVDAAAERLRQAALLGCQNDWMEVAFWDLAAQAQQRPLHELIAERLGKKSASPRPLRAYASFGEVRSPEVRAEALERAQRLGFTGAKINLTGSERSERESLRLLRSEVHSDFELIVHARQASCISVVQDLPRLDLNSARALSEVCAEARVAWLQEPLRHEEWEALAELTRSAPLPIAGGDIARGAGDLELLLDRGCYRIFTPDVTFVGLSNVVALMKRCLDRGLGFSPSVYGGGLSFAANLHALAGWSSACETPALFEVPWEPPAMIPENRDALLAEPFHLASDGTVPLTVGAGLGVSVEEKALRRYGHRFYTTTPVRFVVSSARRSGLLRTASYAQRSKSEVAPPVE